MPAYPALIVGNTMLASDDTGSLFGLDLDSHRVIWRLPLIDPTALMGDETGIAAQLGGRIVVLDPRTGQTIGQAVAKPRPVPSQTGPVSQPSATSNRTELMPRKSLVWAGNGFVVLVDDSTETLSVRRMNDPGRPLWTAPNRWNYWDDDAGTSVYVVAGKWVNTGDGLRDLATGAVAPFRGDTAPYGRVTPGVYYVGSSPDRVFAVSTRPGQPALLTPIDVPSHAPYPTGEFLADTLETDPALPVVVGRVADGTDATYPTAGYSWPSGELLWQQPSFVMSPSSPSGFVGAAYVSSTSDRSLVVIDALTGKELWRRAPVTSDLVAPLWTNIGSTLYVMDDSLTAYDVSSGCTRLWSQPLPEPASPRWSRLFAAPGHVFLKTELGHLWVMDV